MPIFEITKPSSFKMRAYGLGLNFFPTYRRTGGRAIYISNDFMEVHIRLKLGWGTRNAVGTMFGGSLSSAADPIYMIQLMRLLGDEYIVWDKAASIRFRKPGNQTLYTRFLITDELLESIKKRVIEEREFDLVLESDWVDKSGSVYATVSKTIYIADKGFYKGKKAVKKNK